MIDREEINCPHCGATWGSERVADVFSTAPLTPEQEKAYEAKKK